ncbi:hypothetical protein AB1Y20_020462 [Prymnesium parvum]|uniref:Uncharacterized protein n=1 Tax=Prymnesium parvum TaxID=97485 RepID=A0AB34JZD9_PRYPA
MARVGWLRLAAPQLAWMISGTCFLVVAAFAELAMTRNGGQIVDLLSRASTPPEELDRVFFTIGSQLLTVAVIKHLGEFLLRVSGERVAIDARTKLFDALLQQDVSFFDRTPNGSLVALLTTDVDAIQHAVALHLPDVVRYGFAAACSAAWMASISWRLTMFGLMAGPPIGLLASLFGGYLNALSRRHQLQLSAAAAVASESIACVRTIKAFGRESLVAETYQGEVLRSCSLALREYGWHKCWNASNLLMAACATGLVVRAGSRAVLSGDLSAGDLLSFAVFGVSTGQAANEAANHWASMSNSAARGSRAVSMMEERGKSTGELANAFKVQVATSRVHATRPLYHQGWTLVVWQMPHSSANGVAVELHGLRFRYPSVDGCSPGNALDAINFTADAGKMTALVGPSGCGKSTILNLILQFYEPLEGGIKIGGVSLGSLPPGWLRNYVAVVPQDADLFRGSLRHNITFGGYDMIVGERGNTLSGGQRQRALAMVGMTKLVVAHRLSTISDAHLIQVLDHGSIVEKGQHKDLVQAGGKYAQLTASALNR